MIWNTTVCAIYKKKASPVTGTTYMEHARGSDNINLSSFRIEMLLQFARNEKSLSPYLTWNDPLLFSIFVVCVGFRATIKRKYDVTHS